MNARNEAEVEERGRERSSGAPEAAVCSACGEAIAGVFFRASGQVVCAGCRERRIAEREAGSAGGRFVRAAALGVGAAVVSAVGWYWIARLTEREFGLIAILVGLLVGGAVRLGARRRGGWAYQGLAMLLTYTAIVSSYIPAILEAAGEWGDEAAIAELAADASLDAGAVGPGGAVVGEEALAAVEPADGSGSGALAPAVPGTVPEDESARVEAAGAEDGVVDAGLAGVGLGILFLFGLAFMAPFLGGFENVFGWVILGIALYQAWTMNRREVLEFEGPFTSSGGRSTYVPETPPPPIAP